METITIQDLFQGEDRATYFMLKNKAIELGLTVYTFSIMLANAIEDKIVTDIEEKELVFILNISKSNN